MNRDLSVIEKIFGYCKEIDEANEAFGCTPEELESKSIYRNAVCLCLMQIGELSKNLSEEFKEEHKDIPWREIRGMRNIVAHEYGKIDTQIIWETIEDGIPLLKEFCSKLISKD